MNPSQANEPTIAETALRQLMEGNARFTAGTLEHPHTDAARRAEVLGGQAPFAVIVTCSDSRVPPELIFDQGIGDLFVIRTAGNVLDEVALGSVEYAVEHLGTPLVLVMGHQKCGAVSAVVSGAKLSGHLVDIARQIEPAVAQGRARPGDLTANAIDANVRNIVSKLIQSEPILAEHVTAGSVTILPARYDLDTGQVTLLIDK